MFGSNGSTEAARLRDAVTQARARPGVGVSLPDRRNGSATLPRGRSPLVVARQGVGEHTHVVEAADERVDDLRDAVPAKRGDAA